MTQRKKSMPVRSSLCRACHARHIINKGLPIFTVLHSVYLVLFIIYFIEFFVICSPVSLPCLHACWTHYELPIHPRSSSLMFFRAFFCLCRRHACMHACMPPYYLGCCVAHFSHLLLFKGVLLGELRPINRINQSIISPNHALLNRSS